jgi:hypothetical protein
MNNLFNFEYETTKLRNKDNSASRFAVVYGENGKIIHTKKDSFEVIKTSELSILGNTFMDKGYDVKPFVHKHGEIIGLNIYIGGNVAKVGDKKYNAIITVPNSIGSKGYLSLQEVRLICSNGMVRSTKTKDNNIKIPHNITYPNAIRLVSQALDGFLYLIEKAEAQDLMMNSIELTKEEAMYKLNQWFFEKEMPISHKKDMTFNKFREMVVVEPEEIKSIDRYIELRNSFIAELGYNETLGLPLSVYTVYATITNYLSRRMEKSRTIAPSEIKMQRESQKLNTFLLV